MGAKKKTATPRPPRARPRVNGDDATRCRCIDGESGVFDKPLRAAIQPFQQRDFSGGNKVNRGSAFSLGRIDFETALALQSVQSDSGP